MFVGEARISDVIASRRLASDWLGDDITWRCIGGYDSASAPLEAEEDARLSTLPFSPPHSGSSDSVTFDPPRAFSPSLAPSYPRSRHLGRSRSASFSPLSLFSRFSQPPSHPRFPLSTPVGNFSRLGCTHEWCAPSPSISHSPLHTPSLSRIRFCHFIPLRPFSPAAEMPLPPHFHLTIILVLQILLAPLALSGETSAPARPVKFHYEINPGEYSYSERSSRFFLLLFIIVFYCPIVATAARSRFQLYHEL